MSWELALASTHRGEAGARWLANCTSRATSPDGVLRSSERGLANGRLGSCMRGAGRARFLGMRQEAPVDQDDRLAEQVIGDGPWVHEGLLS